MNCTEPQKAKEGVSWYDHVVLETPIGRAIIEWESWKDSPSYDVQIGNDWVGCESDLDTAKKLARIFVLYTVLTTGFYNQLTIKLIHYEIKVILQSRKYSNRARFMV